MDKKTLDKIIELRKTKKIADVALSLGLKKRVVEYWIKRLKDKGVKIEAQEHRGRKPLI